MRTQGGGTTGLFIALSLFFHADDRLRYGRSGRFGCLFRFFAFAAFVLFGFGRFFGFNGFFRRLVVCFSFNFCFGLASTASTGLASSFWASAGLPSAFGAALAAFSLAASASALARASAFAAASASALAFSSSAWVDELSVAGRFSALS